MTSPQLPTRIAHQRLDAYRVAFELFVGVEQIARRFPSGHADLRDQLRRAAAATVRNLAEGANRVLPRDKAARFAVARGEAGETEAALEMAAALGLAPQQRIRELRGLADRVALRRQGYGGHAAMLWGLVRRERSRQRQ